MGNWMQNRETINSRISEQIFTAEDVRMSVYETAS